MAGSTYPFTDGSIITAAGQNQSTSVVNEIYTGSGFNSSKSAGSAGTSTASHELTAISSADLYDCNYIRIKILHKDVSYPYNEDSSASTQIKIESKEIAGSYADTMAVQTTLSFANNGSFNSGQSVHVLTTSEWIHELTTGEKSNGVQFKITSNSITVGATVSNTSASVTNVQTVLERIHGDNS